MTERTQEAESKGNARRRLVRGVFAAPAVLTLHSGSALAAASNLQCVVRQNANRVTPVPLVQTSGSLDRYLRYQLWVLQSNTNPSDLSYYHVRGADLAAMVRLGQAPYLSSSQAQVVDIVNNTAGAIYASNTSTPGLTAVRSNKYVVLRINSSGAVVGVADGTTGSAVSASCWTSFFTGSPA